MAAATRTRKLTPAHRAHSYLRASMESGYTGLPAEHHHARQQIMRSHERAYKHVRAHALAGADRDFDTPLTPGEREHQRYLRQQEGLTEAQVREMRDELRGRAARQDHQRQTPRREANTPASQAIKPAATAARGTHNAIDAAITGKGSLPLQIAGIFLGLSLLYLLVAGKNIPRALAGVSNLAVGAAKAFISPTTDPLKAAETALGAKGHAPPTAAEKSEAGGEATAGVGLGPSKVNSGHLTTSVDAAGQLVAAKPAPKPSAVTVKPASEAKSKAFARALKHYQALPGHGGYTP